MQEDSKETKKSVVMKTENKISKISPEKKLNQHGNKNIKDQRIFRLNN
jgi:hypothetical protein